MAVGYPGNINTYIPTLELSGNLQVGFSRNPKKFPLNEYIKLIPVKQPRGSYIYLNPNDVARLKNPGTGNKWAAGNLRPVGFENNAGFEAKEFSCLRYNYGGVLDKLAVDVANWDVQKTHTEMYAQQAMTDRTYDVCSVITTSGNYPSANVVTASSLAGGFLDAGTTADPRIYKALNGAARIIQAATFGRVKHGDLAWIANATTALKLSQSRELREYVMQQPDAIRNIRFDSATYNGMYGLPDRLYSYRTVVEDTFYNSYNRGNASEAGSPAFPDNTILVFVREGDLVGAEGAAGYSTFSLFVYEDLTVESRDDTWNRLLEMAVVDHRVPKVVAPVTGVLITNVFS